MVDEACGPAIEPVLPPVATAILLASCFGSRKLSPLLCIGFGVWLLCSGEEWMGDADFLVLVSALTLWLPRVELRGETRPV